MYVGVQQVVGMAMPVSAPVPDWQSRIAQSSAPVNMEEWLWACCCLPFANAKAKSDADKSNPVYNFCCWSPVGVYSYVRLGYRIPGTCGDDMGYSLLCTPCTVRRTMTETRIRGPIPNPAYGANMNQWHVSLFDCSPVELCETVFCTPCMTHEVRVALQPEAQQSCCFDALCIVPTSMYGQVRNNYGIITDIPIIEDTLLPLLCFPCALNRARKEARWQKSNHHTGGASIVETLLRK